LHSSLFSHLYEANNHRALCPAGRLLRHAERKSLDFSTHTGYLFPSRCRVGWVFAPRIGRPIICSTSRIVIPFVHTSFTCVPYPTNLIPAPAQSRMQSLGVPSPWSNMSYTIIHCGVNHFIIPIISSKTISKPLGSEKNVST